MRGLWDIGYRTVKSNDSYDPTFVSVLYINNTFIMYKFDGKFIEALWLRLLLNLKKDNCDKEVLNI
jgi:hypothetical protein